MMVICNAEDARNLVVMVRRRHPGQLRPPARPVGAPPSRSQRVPTDPPRAASGNCDCPTCGGSRQVPVNNLGEPGAFEFVPCPVCSIASN